MNDPTRGARISLAMTRCGSRTNAHFGALLDASPSTVSRWRQGQPISLKYAARIALMSNLSLDWLLTGRNRQPSVTDLYPDLEEFALRFNGLPPESRTLVIHLLDRLTLNRTMNDHIERGEGDEQRHVG